MTIFVQIASYRDPQLNPTLDDMLNKAKHPERITVGVCRQFHPEDGFDTLPAYRRDRRFRILDVLHSHSGGACWARHLTQRLYAGETYTLQIDSHMRFVPHWDEVLVTMLEGLRAWGFRKPLLSTYAASFEPGKPLPSPKSEPPTQMSCGGFAPNGMIILVPETIPNWQQLTRPVRARFLAGGFYFTLGKFCREVPYDPGVYFQGEEISLAVRAFTCGYDLFHPHQMLLWHYYSRPTSSKHWTDHNNWGDRDLVSTRKVRQLLGMEEPKPNGGFGPYGLGTVRSLREYEDYAKISFVARKPAPLAGLKAAG